MKKKTKSQSKWKPTIEGKYSQKLLLRFTPEESEVLDELKKHFGEKTYSGTIVKSIMNYMPVRLTLDEFVTKSLKSDLELKELKDRAKTLTEVFSYFMKL